MERRGRRFPRARGKTRWQPITRLSGPPAPDLPIQAYAQQIVQHIHANRITFVQGETGSGKSSRVPQMILDDPKASGSKSMRVVATQPRRIAAISLARYVAGQREVSLGDEVGYAVHENSTQSCTSTRLLFVTPAYLLKWLSGSKAAIQEISHLILDEVHDRSIEQDLLFLLLRLIMTEASTNCNVKLIIMSATSEISSLQKYFSFLLDGQMCHPIVVNENNANNPVKIIYAEDIMEEMPTLSTVGSDLVHRLVKFPATGRNVPDFLLDLIGEILLHQAHAGDIFLIFMPSLANMIEMKSRLLKRLRVSSVLHFKILLLHSYISQEQQQEIFQPPSLVSANVIISTNIAESGITIPGVRCVIDLGMEKIICFNSKRGVNVLNNFWCSRASLKQRAGRAARDLASGIVIRLFTRKTYEQLSDYAELKMTRFFVDKVVLKINALMSSFGLVDALILKLPEPPCPDDIKQSLKFLQYSGAIEVIPDGSSHLTQLGRLTIKLSLEVQASRLIIMGLLLSCSVDCVVMAAGLDQFKEPKLSSECQNLLSLQQDRLRYFRARKFYDGDMYSDMILFCKIYIQWMQNGWDEKWMKEACLNPESLKLFVEKVRSLAMGVVSFMRDEKLTGSMQNEYSKLLSLVKGDSYHLEHTSQTFSKDLALVLLSITGAFHRNVMIGTVPTNRLAQSESMEIKNAGLDACSTFKLSNIPSELLSDVENFENMLQVLGPVSKVLVLDNNTALVETRFVRRQDCTTLMDLPESAQAAYFLACQEKENNLLVCLTKKSPEREEAVNLGKPSKYRQICWSTYVRGQRYGVIFDRYSSLLRSAIEVRSHIQFHVAVAASFMEVENSKVYVSNATVLPSENFFSLLALLLFRPFQTFLIRTDPSHEWVYSLTYGPIVFNWAPRYIFFQQLHVIEGIRVRLNAMMSGNGLFGGIQEDILQLLDWFSSQSNCEPHLNPDVGPWREYPSLKFIDAENFDSAWKLNIASESEKLSDYGTQNSIRSSAHHSRPDLTDYSNYRGKGYSVYGLQDTESESLLKSFRSIEPDLEKQILEDWIDGSKQLNPIFYGLLKRLVAENSLKKQACVVLKYMHKKRHDLVTKAKQMELEGWYHTLCNPEYLDPTPQNASKAALAQKVVLQKYHAVQGWVSTQLSLQEGYLPMVSKSMNLTARQLDRLHKKKMFLKSQVMISVPGNKSQSDNVIVFGHPKEVEAAVRWIETFTAKEKTGNLWNGIYKTYFDLEEQSGLVSCVEVGQSEGSNDKNITSIHEYTQFLVEGCRKNCSSNLQRSGSILKETLTVVENCLPLIEKSAAIEIQARLGRVVFACSNQTKSTLPFLKSQPLGEMKSFLDRRIIHKKCFNDSITKQDFFFVRACLKLYRPEYINERKNTIFFADLVQPLEDHHSTKITLTDCVSEPGKFSLIKVQKKERLAAIDIVQMKTGPIRADIRLSVQALKEEEVEDCYKDFVSKIQRDGAVLKFPQGPFDVMVQRIKTSEIYIFDGFSVSLDEITQVQGNNYTEKYEIEFSPIFQAKLRLSVCDVLENLTAFVSKILEQAQSVSNELCLNQPSSSSLALSHAMLRSWKIWGEDVKIKSLLLEYIYQDLCPATLSEACQKKEAIVLEIDVSTLICTLLENFWQIDGTEVRRVNMSEILLMCLFRTLQSMGFSFSVVMESRAQKIISREGFPPNAALAYTSIFKCHCLPHEKRMKSLPPHLLELTIDKKEIMEKDLCKYLEDEDVHEHLNNMNSHLFIQRMFFSMQRHWSAENPDCFLRLYSFTLQYEHRVSKEEPLTLNFIRWLLCKNHFEAAAFVLSCASFYINDTKSSKVYDRSHVTPLLLLLDQVKDLNLIITEDCRSRALEILVHLEAANVSMQEIEKKVFAVYQVDEAAFRHCHYQKILSCGLTLKAIHLQELQRRGLTENVCHSMNFRTWASGKKITSSCLIPGLNKEGNSLIGSPGIFIPARDPSGQITGAQIKADKVTGGKYKWLSSNKMFEGGRGPSLNGELPLFCCVPLGKGTSTMGMCEGGLKAHVLSSLAALPVIGASGGSFPQSRSLLERYLAIMNPEYIIFFPDAGSQCNDQVSRCYFQTFRLIRELGYFLLIAWWGQVNKFEHEDIDDLLCNTSLIATNIELLSPTSFWHVLHPSVRKKLSKEFPEFDNLCLHSELDDPQDTFIDDDSIKISRIISHSQHEGERKPSHAGFLISIPKQIMECMPSAPNDMVTPASLQEFNIEVRIIQISHVDLVSSCIDWLLQDTARSTTCVGFRCKNGVDCIPCLIQLSVHQRCLLIQIPSDMHDLVKSSRLQTILLDTNVIKAGMEIAKDALYIFHYLKVVTNNCINISHHCTGQIHKDGLLSMFRKLFKWGWSEKNQISCSNWGSHQLTLEQTKYAVLSTWSSRLIWACQRERGKSDVPAFSLNKLPHQLLNYFQRSLFSSDASNQRENTPFELMGAGLELQPGYLTLQQSNFRSRVMGLNSTVELRFKDGRKPEKYATRMRKGSKVLLDIRKSLLNDNGSCGSSVDISMISNLFVDNSKNSNLQKQKLEDAIYFLLCNPTACPSHILMAVRCLENNGMAFQERQLTLKQRHSVKEKRELNASQIDAWEMMLSKPLSAVIGPPGTGKTTLIAAVAKNWSHLADSGETLLCSAHQNVAIRHIAETMIKQNLPGVMLLISQDYYVDWHEKDYTQLQDYLVVTGFGTAAGLKSWAARNRRQTPRILLCTLAVIGSQSFDTSLMGSKISSMIIDECSQTAEGSLISTLVCLPHLQTLSVLGDPCQLPPFGKPMQSVFDLVAKSCMVKILQFQYRMPKCIADFVSDEFYDGKLCTPLKCEEMSKQNAYEPLVWVNVRGSAKVAAGGTSLCNEMEAEAITKFCKEYKTRATAASTLPSSSISGLAAAKSGKLVVLTLYEAQRFQISNLLREGEVEGIPVHNVDSFQGQEAEIVAISLAVGDRMSPFAGDRRRACVLLSRAKRYLCVFGNIDAVKACRNNFQPTFSNIWQTLAHHCEKHHWVVEGEDTPSLIQFMFQQ